MSPTRAYVGGTVMDDPSRPVSGIAVVNLNGPHVTLVGRTAPAAVNTTYLAARPGGDVVYAAAYDPAETLSAWRVAGDELEPLGSVPAGGGRACHLAVHPSAPFVLAAGYRDGTVAVHPVDAAGAPAAASHVIAHTGSGPDPGRQAAAHVHMVTIDPVRGDVLAVDLGTDTIHRYRLDEGSGRLAELDRIALPPGTGPRHLVVLGDRAYVAGELASTLTVVDLAASPPRVVTTVPTGDTGGPARCYPSAIRASLDGRFCYVANRGPNTLDTFDVSSGAPVRRASTGIGGDYPWDLVVAGRHLYAVNQRSGDLTTFALDPSTGVPERVGASVAVPSPACILAV
ncbi:lactonase family protein [Jiangella anatolica]|uniref:3-carboxymuconate cyclase n=1 Tax=Jiangella anatolica TaxID=2670374 RepID=A0A2W2B7L7_9ACTN|nr:beta-propeller fold lactonase family protein [Jiangella anatolica]PZF81090.1 3-carboxymuconate cyclase [Jiangella anatolica]